MNTKTENNPGSRWGHTFIFDQVRNEVLLFGGRREDSSFLNDTWSWNGKSWKYHEVASPPPRGFAATAFHIERGTIILHGGRGEERQTLSDTWEWNGKEWIKLEETGPYKSDHHQMVYVEHKNELLAFGGWNGKDVSGETWIWNGEWKRVSVQGPRKRGAFGMTYVPLDKRVLLFGGLWVEGQYADIWQWKHNSWEQLGGPYDNSSIDHHAMTYDINNQKVIIFGGKNYRYRPLNRTQTIEDKKVFLLTQDGPSPRHSLGLTYDFNHERVILYGGKEYQEETQVALSDLWNWDGDQWYLVTPEIEEQ